MLRSALKAGYVALVGSIPLGWKSLNQIDMVKRRYAWGVNHYGEVLDGKQPRLKKKIFARLSTEDYRCRLPDAKHPVIKVKMGRLDLRDKQMIQWLNRRRIWFHA